MIEDILDRYYARKLEQKIKNSLSNYLINNKFEYKEHILDLYIKDDKWKDDFYILVMAIPYAECFNILINEKQYGDLMLNITKLIEEKIR